MNRYIKKHFSESDLLVIAMNLLPVWGVWFQGWDPKLIFLVYCLESLIVGVYNVIRMWMTTLIKRKDEWANNGSTTMVSGYFFILFFIAHYGFFIFVQMSIFLGVLNNKSLPSAPGCFFEFVLHIPRYLPNYALWLLLGFCISYGFSTLKNFILNGAYRTASIGALMFQPYGRIFIQQFVVILGSFFLMFGAGKIFILLFAVVKIFFDVAIDFERLLEMEMKKKKEVVV